jgi:hypothetical protein
VTGLFDIWDNYSELGERPAIRCLRESEHCLQADGRNIYSAFKIYQNKDDGKGSD